jgi:hypothetical protein
MSVNLHLLFLRHKRVDLSDLAHFWSRVTPEEDVFGNLSRLQGTSVDCQMTEEESND